MAASTTAAGRRIVRRVLSAIEPWYDWGTIHVERMERQTITHSVEGPVRYFDLQWFGLHLGCQVGRVPCKGGR